MTQDARARTLAVLRELVSGADPLLALLADGLVAAVEGESPRDLADPAWREACDRITVAAERLALRGESAAPLVEALVEVDAALASAGLAAGPWAARLAPLAAERFCHVTRTRDVEAARLAAANLSPIARLDQRTVLAAPVGELGDEGRARFGDRILAEALRSAPRRVILLIDGLPEADREERVWSVLAGDLAAQGIAFERR